MPLPPGAVFWSPLAQRFYQEGRRGALSGEKAIERLEFNPAKKAFVDERGRSVPDKVLQAVERRVTSFLARDAKGRPFMASQFVDKKITRSQASQLSPNSNQQVMVRVVVRTADGKAHVFYTSSSLGRRPNMEDLTLKANARAAGGLREKGYKIPTNKIGEMTLIREYIIRTVRVIR